MPRASRRRGSLVWPGGELGHRLSTEPCGGTGGMESLGRGEARTRPGRRAAMARAAQAILVRRMIAAHSGEPAFSDALLPGRNVTIILRVGVLNAAEGGDAHAVEVGTRLGGVTLKIAVQRTVLLRNG